MMRADLATQALPAVERRALGIPAYLRITATLLITALVAWGQIPSRPSGGPPAQDNAQIVIAFEHQVARYVELRTKEAGSSPKPTKSSAKLAETREQMAKNIRAARSSARQGDIFTPEIEAYFRRQIAAILAGPQGEKIRASLRHAEPVKGLQLRINGQYPQGVPLQSTPPSLLLNLPTLPKELEYRIVGNDLVLHDTAPNIVVDFISNVVP